ncbi:hypothetical protein Tco_1546232 [Tanacetum coccineum]
MIHKAYSSHKAWSPEETPDSSYFCVGEIPQHDLKNKGIFDSGCSRHIIGNKYFLTDYQDIDGGFVAFGGSARGGFSDQTHNKTPYELIIGRPPRISFMRPFGCPVTILDTLDPLGKFDGKDEEGFLVGTAMEQTNKNAGPQEANGDTDDPLMPDLEDTDEVQNTGIFGSAFDDEDLDTYNSPFADQVMDAEADFNNMEPSTVVSPIPTTRVHSIHLKDQIIGDPKSAVQTRGMSKKSSGEHAMISYIQKAEKDKSQRFPELLICMFPLSAGTHKDSSSP